jgi:copper homeostasis protein
LSSVAPQPPRKRFLLEVAIASIEDARAAEAGGADRLELNAALSLGGLTPSLGALTEARQAITLPLFAMLRPRPGAFCYSASEFRVLLRDLDLLLSHGADGVVVGILNADATVDRIRCGEVVRQAGCHPVVFHRALDLTPDPTQALEALIDIGVHRVMTSGQEATALAGASNIAALARLAAGRIEVLPAGGVTADNVFELLRQTSCDQVHGSLRGIGRDPSAERRPELTFSRPAPPPDLYEITDGAHVRRLREAMDTLPRG